MTAPRSLLGDWARSILLDIEGTTTPVDFVKDVLFPYAREHTPELLRDDGSDPEVLGDVERLAAERAAEPEGSGAPRWRSASAAEERASALAYVSWLMDRDRKSTGLKSLQGKVWKRGYETGALQGPVYEDVPRTLKRFRLEGRLVSIFSSGSVLAQKLLFSHTDAGDLTPLLYRYFDTTTGSKKAKESYTAIAQALSLRASEILFVSDVAEELDAARAAHFGTALCVRPGAPRPIAPRHHVIASLDEI